MDGIGPIRPTEPQIFRKQRESFGDSKARPTKKHPEEEPVDPENEDSVPEEELHEGGIDLEV